MQKSKTLEKLNRIDYSDFPAYMRISSFIKRTGYAVSDRALRRYANSGLINYYRLEDAKVLFVKTSEIQELAERYA